MEVGGRNEPSTGIKVLPFSRSSSQWQRKECQKILISPKSKLNWNDISLIRLFTVPYFSWDRLDIPRLTVMGILIFKCTEGAGIRDYSSGDEKNRGTVITSLQLVFTECVVIVILRSFSVELKLSQAQCKRIFQGSLTLLASFELVTSCQKIKVLYMRSNGILFL